MNSLFPIFLKIEQLNTLIVGGAEIGQEKLYALLANCPEANITIVAPEVNTYIKGIAENYQKVKLKLKPFDPRDLNGMDLVIVGTSIEAVKQEVHAAAKSHGVLINVADTPQLCDFYLGSVVKKGDLKIAISTNGKSPTLAKRMREYLEEALPNNLNDTLNNLKGIRSKIKGDFKDRLNRLNEITSSLIKDDEKS